MSPSVFGVLAQHVQRCATDGIPERVGMEGSVREEFVRGVHFGCADVLCVKALVAGSVYGTRSACRKGDVENLRSGLVFLILSPLLL